VSEATRVAAPPPKPLMIFDGDCNFCRRWIDRWRQTTGEEIEYTPFQNPEVTTRLPELPRAGLEQAVHLVEPNGWVYRGAEAVFRSLCFTRRNGQRLRAGHPPHQPLGWRLYRASPRFAAASEWGYGVVARHRTFFSAITRLLWGQHVERPTFFWVRWLFLRSMGLIYLIAFASLGTQIIGLHGKNGIIPAEQVMPAIRQQGDQHDLGWSRYRRVPTLCWFSTSDSFLRCQCLAGIALSLLVIAGIAPAPCLFLLWAIYLSLATVCVVFLGFQWDNLLLETGFLAIFFAPWCWWPNWRRERPPATAVLWLLRWLLFRLMFESGGVKLLSGDTTWRQLTALNFHYETQPLPTWIGWYAHHLPEWFQKTSVFLMFGIELVVPFLIFLPRRPRQWGCGLLIFLQIAIALTGNYTFFNALTIVLCLTLLDDRALSRFIPRRWWQRQESVLAIPGRAAPQPSARDAATRPEPVDLDFSESLKGQARPWLLAGLSIVVITITGMQLLATFRKPLWGWSPFVTCYEWVQPFRTFNSYGLFSIMTKPRMEIIVEGSSDRQTWRPYEFKYKPGDVKGRPRFVAPHQPRLDWQMWFAALGSYRHNPWFINFCYRLLEGSPEVLALLQQNPFPNQPPKFIRAALYEYHFTDLSTHRREGMWWQREFKGYYCPELSLP
jgi:predicted DCC family thiol-disulfide oxidoreductase YuxK